VSCTRRF